MARKKQTLQQRKANANSKYWRSKADKAWADLVRKMYGGECAVRGCTCTERINSHHILCRDRYRHLRYDINNGIALCPSHHKWGKESAHRNPIWFAHYLIRHCKGVWNHAVKNLSRQPKTKRTYKDEYERLVKKAEQIV